MLNETKSDLCCTGAWDAPAPAGFYANSGGAPRSVVVLPGVGSGGAPNPTTLLGNRGTLGVDTIITWLASQEGADSRCFDQRVSASRRAAEIARLANDLTEKVAGDGATRDRPSTTPVDAQRELARLVTALRSRWLVPDGVTFAKHREAAVKTSQPAPPVTVERVALTVVALACYSPPLILWDRPPSLAWLRPGVMLEIVTINPDPEAR